LSQQLLLAASQASPEGTGSTMLGLPNEEAIDPDARITVQISGLTLGVSVDLHLWGVLRYLIRQSGGGAIGVPASKPDASCIVGYPASPAKAIGAGALATIPDPVAALEAVPRYWCTPNRNIMAPEWAQGNQCTPETPDGSDDEPFTFFSPPITVPGGSEIYGVAVIVPGGGQSVVIRSLTFFVTLEGDGFSAIPVIQIRLPNGYSVTGGDMIPVASDQNFVPEVFQLPVFPTLVVAAGDRIILDMADMLAVGTGSSTTVVQFDGVKRRKT